MQCDKGAHRPVVMMPALQLQQLSELACLCSKKKSNIDSDRYNTWAFQTLMEQSREQE